MRKSFLFIIVCTLCLMLQAQTRFAVIADPHVLATSLFDNGAAFADAKNGSSRVIEYSEQLFDSAMAIILAERPQAVLFVGDLTNDGEKAGHAHIVAKLQELKAAGIAPIVIPGNNDIANKNAYSYSGADKTATESVTEAEYNELYAPFGLNDAVSREADSLSYMVYPTDKIALICLNSAKKNTPSKQFNEGGLYESTIAWAEAAAAQAKASGRMVIALMHHQATNHFNMESEMTPTYIANTTDEYPPLEDLQNRFIMAGIEVILTGHYHMTSIKHTLNAGTTLYDISTGSLSCYPSPIRWLSVADNGELTVSTQVIDTHHTLELKRNENSAKKIISRIADVAYPKIAEVQNDTKYKVLLMMAGLSFDDFNLPQSKAQMIEDLNASMLPSMTTMVNELSRGDEHTRNAAQNFQACLDGFDHYITQTICMGNDELATILLTLVTDYRNMLKAMCQSVFYNYVGEDETQVVADNTNTLQLTVPQVTSLQTTNNQLPTTKVLHNGTIRILRNGHTYDVLGKQLD